MTTQIGYARVSKADGSQVPDLQRDALVAALGGIALLDELVTSELIVAGVLIVTGIGLTLRR